MNRDFAADVLTQNLNEVVSWWIFERVPHVFGDDLEAYTTWRHLLAGKLGVDPRCIALTGSSGVGLSLNPDKHLRAFNDESDIDVAVISTYHFDYAWRTIRNLGPKLFRLDNRAIRAVRDHRSKYIYWGTIATDKILHLLPFGKPWSIALAQMGGVEPTEGREINARIYRDYASLRAYQVSSLKEVRRMLAT